MAWHNRYKLGKASKKDKWRIIACSMASNKSVGLVHVTIWKKKEIKSLLINEKYEAAAFYSLNLAMKLDYYEYISRVVQLVISFD